MNWKPGDIYHRLPVQLQASSFKTYVYACLLQKINTFVHSN
jgi:hypothetical protein